MAPSYLADPISSIEQEISLMEHEVGGDILRVGAEIAPEFVSEPVQSAKDNVLTEPTLPLQLASQNVERDLTPSISSVPGLVVPTETFKPEVPNWLRLNHSRAAVDAPATGATKLRRMIFETKEMVVCPGVYDGLSARTALELGFNGLYMVSDAPQSQQPNRDSNHDCRPEPALRPRSLDSLIWPSPSSTRCARTPR
jgi:hypothetical protein